MADEKTTPEEESKGGKKKLIIIIAAAVVVLLILGGVAAFFLLGDKEEPKEPGADVPVPEINAPTIGPMVDVNEFIINIVSTEDNHFVKASMTFEVSSEATAEEMNKRMPQMRDSIILLISNKDFRELQDIQGKRQLKAELTSRINSILRSGKVTSVYFTDFVVQ